MTNAGPAGGSTGPLTRRNPRVAAARRLTRPAHRAAERAFLAEGPQSVREALARPGTVRHLFVTAAARSRYPELCTAPDVPVSLVTDDAAATLSETATPQGIVAVCEAVDVPLDRVVADRPRLVAVLADIRDPGNAGTVLRTADAAGADAVVFAGTTVDPYNGKCVRASAGSLFHLPLVRASDPVAALTALRTAGLQVLAAAGDGAEDLWQLSDAGRLGRPTTWLLGNEAHGVDATLAAAADTTVRIPMPGRAESLNLAAAAAVLLYESARALRPYAAGETQGTQA